LTRIKFIGIFHNKNLSVADFCSDATKPVNLFKKLKNMQNNQL